MNGVQMPSPSGSRAPTSDHNVPVPFFQNIMKGVQQQSTSRSNAHCVSDTQCRGLCKGHFNKVLSAAYTFMAAVRNTLHDGLLLTFINTSSEQVDLIWRDYDGEEVPIIKMDAGVTHRFSAVTAHNFLCRNTRSGQYYLLNSDYELIGSELFGANKAHRICISAPKSPQTLRSSALSVVARTLGDRYDAFKMSVPFAVQYDLYNEKSLSERREYYSIDGEPGSYSKFYEGKDEGPLIYPPGMDWTSFDDE